MGGLSMSQIWYAAFSEDFVGQAQKIFKKLDKDVIVTVWDPELVPEMLRRGVSVILGRGATALRIRKVVDLPVVEIPIPFEDMADTLIEASRYGRNIGVIGYNNLLSGLECLNPILNVSIRQIFAVDENDTYHQIQKLKNEGIDVIVGGLLQTHYARELGLPAVRIELTDKSLSYACQEAEKLIATVKAATRKAEELKTILNTTNEKYVAVDIKGNITWMNRVAKPYLPNPGGLVYDTPITEVLPAFEAVHDVLTTGEEIIQETGSINGADILYDMIPLTYKNGEILGAVITFNDAGTITRGEHKIRDKGIKGFQATYSFKDICGSSQQMNQCIQHAKRYAHTDLTVLLLGETGSGKEMFAQSMHNASSRRNGPFVAVNCAALPEGILESELFGYDDGAFTGARRSGKMGLFELAHNGTIFLDEIGEMPMSLQSRLLRVLQERKVMRLGGDRVFPVNIRIFAATNKNLMELVGEHKFREDLFYRLNVLTLKIPPLRERVEDIPDLANLFLRESGGKCCLTPAAEKVLTSYGWPGNARQLRHFMEKVRIICDSSVISGEAAGYVIQNYEPTCEMEQRGNGSGFLGSNGTGNYKATKGRVNRNQEEPGQENISREITEECLAQAMEQAGGNKTKAARILGIHRSTIWRYIKKFGME